MKFKIDKKLSKNHYRKFWLYIGITSGILGLLSLKLLIYSLDLIIITDILIFISIGSFRAQHNNGRFKLIKIDNEKKILSITRTEYFYSVDTAEEEIVTRDYIMNDLKDYSINPSYIIIFGDITMKLGIKEWHKKKLHIPRVFCNEELLLKEIEKIKNNQ